MPLALATMLVFVATPAAAHGIVPHGGGFHWPSGPFDILVQAGLLVAALLYWRGRRRRRVGRRRDLAYAAGWLTLFAALVLPLPLYDAESFALHMVEHQLLMLVAAPLLVAARPLALLLAGLPRDWRTDVLRTGRRRSLRPLWRALVDPHVASLQHAFVLWVWHAPLLFEAAVVNDGVHALQHFCFLASALVFWWATMSGPGRVGAAAVYLFATSVHTALLGALMTFSPGLWYRPYADVTIWGLTPMEDQQLAGLVMWVPGGLPYLVAALLLASAWLRRAEARQPALQEAPPRTQNFAQ